MIVWLVGLFSLSSLFLVFCTHRSHSGCITSAESVLITLQSHTEVLNFLDSNGESSSLNYKIPVISISPQSLASCAASLSASLPSTSGAVVTSQQVLRRIQVFCKDVLGFSYVFDTTFARHMALQEHVAEFLERKVKDAGGMESQLPMLASACPGWICYAEKAHAEILPFIARTKSPQQVMGTLVKEWMATHWGKKLVSSDSFLCDSSKSNILGLKKSTMFPLCPAMTKNWKLQDKIFTTMFIQRVTLTVSSLPVN